MNAFAQMLKRHPVVIAAYLLITFYCLGVTIMAFYYYDHLKHRPGTGVEEGGGLILLGDIGMFLFGGVFFLVCGCLAIAYRVEAKFYLWLGLIALIQPIFFLQITDIYAISK